MNKSKQLPQITLKSFSLFFKSSLFILLLGISLAYADPSENPGMKWANWKAFFDRSPRHQLAFGGGGNFILATNSTVDSIAGGTVKARYTFHNAFSLESSADFNRLNARKVSGDVFGIPFLQSFLLHTPYFANVSYYLQAGVGYQFNEEKNLHAGTVKLDVEDGVIVTFGAGADYKLKEKCFLNFDIRYQLADFDIYGPGVKGGDDFNALVFRLALMFRY